MQSPPSFRMIGTINGWIMKRRHKPHPFSQQFPTRLCCHPVACMLWLFRCWPAIPYSMATKPRSTDETLRHVTAGSKKKPFPTFFLTSPFSMMPEYKRNVQFLNISWPPDLFLIPQQASSWNSMVDFIHQSKRFRFNYGSTINPIPPSCHYSSVVATFSASHALGSTS